MEKLSGRQEARRLYTKFISEAEAIDLWSLNTDRHREHNWTCRTRGSTDSGNIINHVAVSKTSFNDGEIKVADRNSDYIPLTDHRAIIAHINIDPPLQPNPSQMNFTDRTKMTYNKPRIKYPSKLEKHKFEQF
jgi:hypothetical protein